MPIHSIHLWRKSYLVLVLATLALVALADRLLYAQRVGWTAAVVAAAMLAVLALRDARFLKLPGGRVTWLAALGLLLALVEQPTWLNILYILLCLSVLALINAHGWDSDFVRWLRRLAAWLLSGWARIFLDNGVVMRWLVRRGFSPTLARGIAAWIIPLCFTSVFVALFAWANPVVENWFGRLGTFITHAFERLPDYLNPGRIIFWIFFAAIAWSLLRSRTHRARKHRTSNVRAASPSQPAPHLAPGHDRGLNVNVAREPTQTASAKVPVDRDGATGFPASMVIRCLVLFNLVFAVENILDARYLWASWTSSFPPGFSFSEYVHRGAYPLIAAALLAGLFVLVTFNPRGATERAPWARRLVYFWIAQTILLTLSAAWRLVRYVEMYQLTRLRLASTIWFALVALGLFYIVWRIVRGRSNAWLVNINAVTALLVLYPCCFINFDGLIASFNARHCQEAGGGGAALDIAYIEHLGTPALPALESVRDKLTTAARREQATQIADRLHAELTTDLRDWHAWTWRRARTAQAARRHTPAIPLATTPTPSSSPSPSPSAVAVVIDLVAARSLPSVPRHCADRRLKCLRTFP